MPNRAHAKLRTARAPQSRFVRSYDDALCPKLTSVFFTDPDL